MAKRREASDVKKRGYERFEMTPSSEYFLYGRSGNEDYARELRRVKTELRETVYGEYYDYEKEAEEIKNGVNASALAIMILSVLTLAITLIGRLANFGGVLNIAENKDGVTLIIGFVDAVSGSKQSDLGLYIGALTLIMLILSVLIIVGCAIRLKRRGMGRAVRILAATAFVADVAMIVAELVDMQTVPIGIMILTMLAFVQFAATGGKNKRR